MQSLYHFYSFSKMIYNSLISILVGTFGVTSFLFGFFFFFFGVINCTTRVKLAQKPFLLVHGYIDVKCIFRYGLIELRTNIPVMR